MRDEFEVERNEISEGEIFGKDGGENWRNFSDEIKYIHEIHFEDKFRRK